MLLYTLYCVGARGPADLDMGSKERMSMNYTQHTLFPVLTAL